MPDLTIEQYDLVYNMLSFTFAAMLASFAYFILVRGNVARQYRGALTLSALVVLVAGYHYFRIFESWQGAFTLIDGMYVATGEPFNDAYRYIDWLLTVPLLVAELVAVLALSRARTTSLTLRLGIAAFLMVALGYPGEVADDNTVRAIWGAISTLPFLYILYVLFGELGGAIQKQTGQARVLVRNTRLLLLATWGFYPLVYMIPFLGETGAATLVGIQVGYAIADVAAKCGYGVMIYSIAKAKTDAAETEMVGRGQLATAPVATGD
jgi:bacteriorhodopsin